MGRFLMCVITAGTFLMSAQLYAATQTIVMIRHAEKPKNDSGVLTCQGLNRSLLLPKRLSVYGAPNAIFAAAPKLNQLGHSIRSVQTILPTATTYSLPVNLNYYATDVNGMKNALLNKKLDNATVYVAWQYESLVKIAREVYKKRGGDPKEIPDWKKDDFDSIYIIKYSDTGQLSFTKEAQNFKNLSTTCP